MHRTPSKKKRQISYALPTLKIMYDFLSIFLYPAGLGLADIIRMSIRIYTSCNVIIVTNCQTINQLNMYIIHYFIYILNVNISNLISIE